MLSMEDFEGRKVKKGWSKVDILAEVCSVAEEKERLMQREVRLNNLDILTEACSVAGEKSSSERPVSPVGADGRSKGKLTPSSHGLVPTHQRTDKPLDTWNTSQLLWTSKNLPPSLSLVSPVGGDGRSKGKISMPSSHRLALGDDELKEKQLPSLRTDTSNLSTKEINFLRNPNDLKEKQSSSLLLINNTSHECLSKEADGLLKKHHSLWSSITESPLREDGRTDETELLDIGIVKAQRLEREKALKKPMKIDHRQFQIPNSSNAGGRRRNRSDDTEEKKVPYGKKQKKIMVRVNEEPIPDMPQAYKNLIREMSGSTDYKLIIQKRLRPSDVEPGQSRLSIPLNQVKSPDFISDNEKAELETYNNGFLNTISAKIIGPKEFKETEIKFKRWMVGKSSPSYVLGSKWNHFALDNTLAADDLIQLYSFRVDGILHFAFVIVEKSKGKNSSSGSSTEAIGEGSSSQSQVVAEVPSSTGTLEETVEAIGEHGCRKVKIFAVCVEE